jgi:hypothetical protein
MSLAPLDPESCTLLDPFRTKEIPPELNVLSKRSAVPKLAQTALDEYKFDYVVSQVNMGDNGGRCGYYFLGLVQYLLTGDVLDTSEVFTRIEAQINNCNYDEELRENITVAMSIPHLLEVVEISIYLKSLSINFASVFSSDMPVIVNGKKKKLRKYNCQVNNYSTCNPVWVFAVLTNGAGHYEMWTNFDTANNSHCAAWSHFQAGKLLEAFGQSYPTADIDPCDQMQMMPFFELLELTPEKKKKKKSTNK